MTEPVISTGTHLGYYMALVLFACTVIVAVIGLAALAWVHYEKTAKIHYWMEQDLIRVYRGGHDTGIVIINYGESNYLVLFGENEISHRDWKSTTKTIKRLLN